MVAVALPESLPEVDSFSYVEAENNASVNNEEDTRPLVGIIYPPPDIRNIVDKTAVFVARNGVQFEERIRENEKHNAKFSFLNPNDPYHAYYQYKIAETKGGKVSKKAEPKELKVEIKEEGFLPRAPPKEPPSFEFMNDMPSISAQDLDILKLTAQFVARNGRKFMTALSQREQRNYQFDFLRPNHSLCNYFTKLVEQYTKVLVPQKNLNEKLKSNVDNKYQILERVMQRVEYAAYQEEERKKAEEKEDQERIAYASIDWHDFVIVETVEFTEADETIDLPPPMSIIELENMTLAQKKMASVNIVETHEDKAAEIDMEMDEDVDMEDEEDEQAAADDDEQEQEPVPAVTEIKPPDTSAPMKIVKDYTPKAYAPKTTTERQTSICPRCKQAIPVDEMANHVRIELLDPKWKEQKMAADAKKKESNLLQEGTDVAKILKTFSGYRSDIFGNEETEIGRKIGEEEEKKKRIEKEKVVWDGHTASINMATQRAAAGVSIDEQIAAIHRSKGLTSDSDSKIGPRIPQLQDQHSHQHQLQHIHQQGLQQHIPSAQQPMYTSYQSHTTQNVPIPQGPLPVAYSGYVGSSAPFAHQLPGFITPIASQSVNMASQQPSQVRPPIPTIPQFHRQSLPGRTIEDEVDMGILPKRQKLDNNSSMGTLVSEEEWIASHQGLISIQIQCPIISEKPEWNCQGQIIALDSLSVTTLVSAVKDKIFARLNFPAGKQKLTIGGAVMKNQVSLAYYNIEDGGIIGLAIKDRGKK
ncbi:Pre-mRNA splicing factor PRP21 like protein [Gigaspora rosea]|uniref:Pre-mRNA splicing factor PRP21 like protein n=1 Tax=Gigaspora rosea TaxID=44941 RepID=A0A397U2H5_9GLOM|nr:Pre-mRNA splicing factor PRP21 like protein [Gigaspora rosea]